MILCKGCSIEYEENNFYLNKTGYYHPFCKSCNTIRTREWRRNNTEKHYLNKLKEKFKLTKEDYFILVEKQGYVCAICNQEESNRRLSVDHCHDTGKIRGLLCRSCNLAIGYFNDDVDVMKQAIIYINNTRI